MGAGEAGVTGVGFVVEEEGAGLAGAFDGAGGGVYEVFVDGAERRAAEAAAGVLRPAGAGAGQPAEGEDAGAWDPSLHEITVRRRDARER